MALASHWVLLLMPPTIRAPDEITEGPCTAGFNREGMLEDRKRSILGPLPSDARGPRQIYSVGTSLTR